MTVFAMRAGLCGLSLLALTSAVHAQEAMRLQAHDERGGFCLMANGKGGIESAPCRENAAQSFRVDARSGRIDNARGCITAVGAKAGAAVRLTPCSESNDQQFFPRQVPPHLQFIGRNGFCLGLSGVGVEPGAQLVLEPCHGRPSQLFVPIP